MTEPAKTKDKNQDKTHKKTAKGKDIGETSAQKGETYRNIYDRIFKRIFSLSVKAIISLINGLFGESFPADSSVEYHSNEFVRADLRGRLADVIVTIGGVRTFHLEAQMRSSGRVILRVFEYGFLHAMDAQTRDGTLDFPEPAVVYLDRKRGMPEESVLHVSFGAQGGFDYRVKNFMYLAYGIDELDRKNLVLLLPFQLLRLRRILENWVQEQREAWRQNNGIQKGAQKQRQGKGGTQEAAQKKCRFHALAEIQRLQEEIIHDIIGSINKNLSDGNITEDDANQLLELTNLLQEHIYEEFKKKGGEIELKPLLPGAIELPNDKYRLRISQLEDKLSISENKLSISENKLSISENKLAQYKKENTQYKDKIRVLERHIQELLKKNP